MLVMAKSFVFPGVLESEKIFLDCGLFPCWNQGMTVKKKKRGLEREKKKQTQELRRKLILLMG